MIWSSKVVLNDREEIFNNFIRRSRSINEEEIIMSNSFMFKMLFIVFLFVKSNYPGDINIVEDITILVGMLAILMSGISGFNWTHECNELSWDDPVEITVFNSLVVLVFFHVESSEIIPVEFNCVFQSLEDLEQRAIVEAVTFRGISVMLKKWLVRLKLFPGVFG